MATIYVIVEGARTEPILYGKWLPILVPGHREINRVEDATDDIYFIVAGHGYPSYMDRIKAAVEDIRHPDNRFTHLIVCVDSEECSVAKREAELEQVFRAHDCPIPARTIIADCCIETWLLGHRKIVRRNPESAELRQLLDLYDIVGRDPERMPNLGASTRARSHLRYLRVVFRERDLSYTKQRPGRPPPLTTSLRCVSARTAPPTGAPTSPHSPASSTSPAGSLG